MRMRWLVAVGVGFVSVSATWSQTPLPQAAPTPPPAATIAARPDPIIPAAPPAPPGPGQPPPFLPVPPAPQPPLAEVPRSQPLPGGAGDVEYDPNYQYLPEQTPDRAGRLADQVCGPPGRWWVRPALELTWARTRTVPTNLQLPVPAQITGGTPLPGVQLPAAGLNTGNFQPAFSLEAGRWFGEGNRYGVDASFFFRDSSTTFTGTAPGLLVLFPNGPDRSAPQLYAFADPRFYTTFPVTLDTFFVTADVNYRHNLYCADNARLDALVGYRYAYLGDELYLGDVPNGGHTDYRQNRASVSNSFNGGQVGVAGEVRANGWYVSGTAKIAFGANSTSATTTGLFTGALGQVGGSYQQLQALASGKHNSFAVMPTMGVQLGRQITKRTRLFTGYSFAYLSRVARLGDALNPGSSGLSYASFWVQAVSLGAEFRY